MLLASCNTVANRKVNDGKSSIQQKEVSDAALQLAQAIQELMEEYDVDFPEEVSEQIVRLSNQISQVENKQQQSLNHFESIRQLLENTVSANNLLEKAGFSVEEMKFR